MKIFELRQRRYTWFVSLDKAYERVPRERLWGVLVLLPIPIFGHESWVMTEKVIY